jgi:hypothetical protein
MAYFAELDQNNIVLRVVAIKDEDCLDSNGNEQEQLGINRCLELFQGGIWKQTSYNTLKNAHLNGKTPFRKNYAGMGYTYDESRNAFIPVKPYPSYILNEDTCQWDAPIPRPNDDKFYDWDEENLTWKEFTTNWEPIV